MNNLIETSTSANGSLPFAGVLPMSLSTDGYPVKKRRIKNSGPPVRPQCSECGKDFSNQSALSKHKLTHSDERRFVCHLCQKAFKRQDHLNGHMLTHRDKKPFECDVEGCEKTYCDARSLRRHKENHHLRSNIIIKSESVGQQNYVISTHNNNNNNINTINNGTIPRRVPNDPQNLLHQLLTQQLREPTINASNIHGQIMSLANYPSVASENCNLPANGWSTLEQMSKMLDPMRFDSTNQVECNICQRRFKNLPALNGHMRLHGGYLNNPSTVSNLSVSFGINSLSLQQSQLPPQQQLAKKKVDMSDIETKAIIEAIKEKIMQKHAAPNSDSVKTVGEERNMTTSGNVSVNSVIVCKDPCRSKPCESSDLIGSASEASNSVSSSHTASQQQSCYSFREPSSYASPSSTTDNKLTSLVHHGQSKNDMTNNQSAINMVVGTNLMSSPNGPDLHTANQDSSTHIEQNNNVTNSFSGDHQDKDIDNLLSEKENLNDDSTSDDHSDASCFIETTNGEWFSNIALLREQLQQHIYAPNDMQSSASSQHINRSQFLLPGEKSRRHSDSTAEMAFANSHHANNRTSRLWSEQNRITEDSSFLSSTNMPELKRRNQRAISDPGNEDIDETQSERSHHPEPPGCHQVPNDHQMSATTEKLFQHPQTHTGHQHPNTHHYQPLTHTHPHQQQQHEQPQHPNYSYMHSHSVPTTPTNLNPLLSPAVSYPMSSQSHYNHDPHSLPCTPTQPSNSFSFDSHQVQHYHQQQSLPPTPTDNQLQFNYQTQPVDPYSNPSYDVSAPATTTFSYSSQDSENQARSQSQPTLDPIYEAMNYSANEEESMNDLNDDYSNFEMESLIEHFSSQDGPHHPENQHQPPQSAQTAHQQLVEAPTNSQHQTASGQHQSEFTGSSLLDHSQTHSSSLSTSSGARQNHLDSSTSDQAHNLVINSNIPCKTQSFFSENHDLVSSTLDARSMNYNLQIDYSDIGHLSNNLDLITSAIGPGKTSNTVSSSNVKNDIVAHQQEKHLTVSSGKVENSYGDNHIFSCGKNLNCIESSTDTEDNIKDGQELMESNSCSAEPTPPPSLRSSSSNLVINLSPNAENRDEKLLNGNSEGEDDDEEDEDDDVFINPANISPVTSPKTKSVIKPPVNENSPKRPKHKPEPLYIPPHVNAFGQFASRLRSPRLWDPTGLHSFPSHGHQDLSKNSPPPYTPPPMLSPLRKGSGLYWAIINNGNVTPKSTNLGSFLSNRRSISQSCDKDMGQNNELILSTPTTAYEPEVVYDLDLLSSESDVQPHVNIGSNYQASIPAYIGDCTDAQKYYRRERADQVWDPSVIEKIPSDDLDAYLELACSGCIPGAGRNVELAIHLLHIYHGDIDKCITKLLNSDSLKLPTDHPLYDYQYPETDVWTKEEIGNYYRAMLNADKDFHAIAKKISTKSVKECIQFYYLWKKMSPDDYKKLRIIRRRKENEALYIPTLGRDDLSDINSGILNNNNNNNNDVSTNGDVNTADEDNLSLSAFDSPMNASPSSVCSSATSTATGSVTGGQALNSKDKLFGEYPCKVCGKVFTKVKSRSAHMKVHGAGAAAAATALASMRIQI